MSYAIGCDIGTGGNKAVLVDAEGTVLASSVRAYPTWNPRPQWHEQRPDDWVEAVIGTIRDLVAASPVGSSAIKAVAISGQSLGLVPIDAAGALLADRVPIWSDARAEVEADAFFSTFPQQDWYQLTGNGFPAALYPAFKAMWLREHSPEVFARTSTILGSKDYVNLRLTGVRGTDPSYASGSGVFDLVAGSYHTALMANTGLSENLWPHVNASADAVGTLTDDMAAACGLSSETVVATGAVDNAAMALGARGTSPGGVYNSLGSSAWIAVTSVEPIIDPSAGTYVFSHAAPGLYTSAVSIFGAGTTMRWIRDLVYPEFEAAADSGGFEQMMDDAAASPRGAHGLMMNPTLAGGTKAEGGPRVRGGLIGLDSTHDRGDLVRAAMEGIGLALNRALQSLSRAAEVDDEMLLVGGGSNSALWRQTLADIYGVPIVTSVVGQDAAALGAAALALKAADIWTDLSAVEKCHRVRHEHTPDATAASYYLAASRRYAAFADFVRNQADPPEDSDPKEHTDLQEDKDMNQ